VSIACRRRSWARRGASRRGAGISTNILEIRCATYLEVINRIEASKANADRYGNERRSPLRPALGLGV